MAINVLNSKTHLFLMPPSNPIDYMPFPWGNADVRGV